MKALRKEVREYQKVRAEIWLSPKRKAKIVKQVREALIHSRREVYIPLQRMFGFLEPWPGEEIARMVQQWLRLPAFFERQIYAEWVVIDLGPGDIDDLGELADEV